jgi:hypothetical protein
MGYGSYSISNSAVRTAEYSKLSSTQIFSRRSLDTEMSPKDTIRECRDSVDHPNSIPIIIALDVTGSMGHVPDAFVRNEMTKMMADLYNSGLKDSQVLFMGIGDHECDRVPLQVGQFEADDQLLDKWLKMIFLEGGGGGNKGESYLLAWIYGANNTKIDSFDKRGKKGYIFTIGDEPVLSGISASAQKDIFGAGQFSDISATEALMKAKEKYEVYHFHVTETPTGSYVTTQNGWKQLMGENAIILDSHKDVASAIAKIINNGSSSIEEPVTLVSGVNDKESEMML